MTDIPANTPRPMGSTCSFCPGTANADDADGETRSAAAEAAWGVAPPAAAVDTAEAGIIVTPLAEAAAPTPLPPRALEVAAALTAEAAALPPEAAEVDAEVAAVADADAAEVLSVAVED